MNGHSAVAARAEKVRAALQPAPLSFSEDGYLHYGYTVMFAHKLGTLAINLWEPGVGVNDVLSSVIESKNPMSRNTFILTQLPFENYKDDLIRYGDCFCIQSVPALRADPITNVTRPPFYLHSVLKRSDRLSKLAKEQEVCMTQDIDQDVMFKIMPRNPVKRGVDDGKPVEANIPIVLYHVRSYQALACNKQYDMGSDFGGKEYEVYCKTTTSFAVNGSLEKEIKGLRVASQTAKAELIDNVWTVVTAVKPPENVKQYIPMDTETMLKMIRRAAYDKCDRGGRGLCRALEVMDEHHTDQLQLEDLQFALRDVGMRFERYEVDTLMNGFKRSADGTISLNEFIEALVPPMQENRYNVVMEIFHALDCENNGELYLKLIVPFYDVNSHPTIREAKITQDQALDQLINHFRYTMKPGYISMNEFLDYYLLLSSMYDSDEEFENLVRSNWRI